MTNLVVGRAQLDIERACELLRHCRDVDAVREVRDKAQAIKAYQRERGAGVEAERAAAEIVLRAEVRLGELLLETPKHRGRPSKNGSDSEPISSLAERGIDRKDSMRWQSAARVTEPVRERYVELARERGTAATTSDLVSIGKLDPRAQDQVVSLIASGEARDVRAALAQLHHEERTARMATVRAQVAPLEELGTFSLLLADPPWQYDDATTTPSRAIENHYPTMPLDEILAMRPQLDRITTDSAVLFLWATSPLLVDAFAVLDAWGFTYRSSIAWDKEIPGMGYWVRGQHELLLIATKGEPPPPLAKNRSASVIRERRSRHSRKPVAAYELIERMYPELRRLELFARNARDGWTAWGPESAAA